jgi:hypothetical protein
MKSTIGMALLLTVVAACNATRPPLDEDAIDSGSVQRHGYRPSGAPNPPAVWEDSIDAGSVQHRGWKPSGPPNAPVTWEDSIDAGSVKVARSASSGTDSRSNRSDEDSASNGDRTTVR